MQRLTLPTLDAYLTVKLCNLQIFKQKKRKQNCAQNIISNLSRIACSAVRACLVYIYIKTPVAIKRLLCPSFTRDERGGGGISQKNLFQKLTNSPSLFYKGGEGWEANCVSQTLNVTSFVVWIVSNFSNECLKKFTVYSFVIKVGLWQLVQIWFPAICFIYFPSLFVSLMDSAKSNLCGIVRDSLGHIVASNWLKWPDLEMSLTLHLLKF